MSKHLEFFSSDEEWDQYLSSRVTKRKGEEKKQKESNRLQMQKICSPFASLDISNRLEGNSSGDVIDGRSHRVAAFHSNDDDGEDGDDEHEDEGETETQEEANPVTSQQTRVVGREEIKLFDSPHLPEPQGRDDSTASIEEEVQSECREASVSSYSSSSPSSSSPSSSSSSSSSSLSSSSAADSSVEEKDDKEEEAEEEEEEEEKEENTEDEAEEPIKPVRLRSYSVFSSDTSDEGIPEENGDEEREICTKEKAEQKSFFARRSWEKRVSTTDESDASPKQRRPVQSKNASVFSSKDSGNFSLRREKGESNCSSDEEWDKLLTPVKSRKKTKENKPPSPLYPVTTDKRRFKLLTDSKMTNTDKFLQSLGISIDLTKIPEKRFLSSNKFVVNLFEKLDERLFDSKLTESFVEVKWNGRLTSAAGLTTSKFNMLLVESEIKLSKPILKLRPAGDMVSTLLHEMIHAYLAVKREREPQSHGPLFRINMNRVAAVTGVVLTVYHNFHDECNAIRNQYFWRCDGVCRSLRPKYGYYRSAKNRAPDGFNSWWKTHQATCGGTFVTVNVETVPDFIKGI